jgi:hypothetical protein
MGILPLIPLLIALLVAGNMHDGRVIHSLYLPLVNPLEEGQPSRCSACGSGVVMRDRACL